MRHNHVVYIGVKNSTMVPAVVQNLHRTDYEVVIGETMNSFSELVNTCAKMCTTDIFIFCSHKVRPTDADIDKIVTLLKSGYGYVGLYCFGCFGVHKDIFDKIGYFDEDFLRGRYEDDDFKLRLQLHNIAFYEDHSVLYYCCESTWANEESTLISYNIFLTKYSIDYTNKVIYVLNKDNKKQIDVSNYLPFDQSVHIPLQSASAFYALKSFQTFRLT